MFQNFGGGAQLGRPAPFDISAWSGATLLGDWTLLVPSRRGAFFGLRASEPITRIAVNNPLAFDLVDNIAFERPGPRSAERLAARPAAVPEPLAAALIGFGFAALAFIRRRA